MQSSSTSSNNTYLIRASSVYEAAVSDSRSTLSRLLTETKGYYCVILYRESIVAYMSTYFLRGGSLRILQSLYLVMSLRLAIPNGIVPGR
ncbi:hypothetical protein F2Q68_00043827 [Brassica cretica]|uniref:Uncharacterized protein n=1 Tax=Brassica cretica TaxID=69181 RepID=A0A8S9LIL3_BRACR|nr:hypothetical protein F2Q68_00043827 [Brassica cretica]